MKKTHIIMALAGAVLITLGGNSFAAQSKSLNLFCWSEYIPQGVLDGFTKETGIKVNYETYGSNEEMLAKMLPSKGKYDLIVPSEYVVEALVKRNKLEALDKSKIPNFKNIGKEFTGFPFDPENKYSVPYMTGSVGIVVNTDKVKDDIKGYKDVFQEKFKNRIVALNDNREIVSWALSTAGIDINDVTPETIAKIKPTLKEWLPLVKVYDSDSPKTALLNGDVDLGIVWGGEAAILYKQDKKFKYILPAQGAHRFIDNICMPAAAPHPDAALAFINYILQPEVSKLISEAFPYTNPNVEAQKLLSPEELANPASYPTGNPKLEIFRDIGKMATNLDKLMTDLKSH